MRRGRPRKVNDEGAVVIREWYAARRKLGTPKQMRARFNISSNTLSKIARGKLHG